MRALSITLLLALGGAPSFGQKFGAAENLAPYIPTPEAVVQRMLEAAHVRPNDVVYDLGAGDGRIVIMAAQRYGARAVGVEIMPDLCRKATQRIQMMGLADRVQMMEDSVFRVDLSPATVVTMFFLTSSNERIKPNLEKYLKPGARVVSNEFPMKGWKPSEVVHVKSGTMSHSIYVYEIGKQK
jgi:16S rRNA A1518/A1519 N6-dimethyltransferase RsmA/KsgA/DIM1 with predicted DNA glycosylase/AP lyase activity